ncbi:MAG TPA: cyclic nucleotide-binding domain-containing protein [Candidatus Kapabacteria bacterium]|jgi:hypothetical protein|nr:cyclic nucleotide-binding domain-containing protein [Ignavibacteria bacterium]HRE58379.1 cyclic nucleotide-binding domain-containing protein [Candidatus Kapabacteria bacterium]HRI30251.1 cyclic nucleotide-binding domain-containing protein [Candidatus Kapabacteria bacterium]HRK60344.1 cyclic nucleotide-binding domain-containing protein [Candidatus Kapabacteria bacterium]
MQFTLWDILAHSYNLLYLTAFIVKDMLWLRILLCLASIMEVVYSYNVGTDPLWPNILWCSAYVGVNAYQFFRVVQERQSLNLSEEENVMYAAMFSTMSKVLFRRLINIGEWRTYDIGEKLIEEGNTCKELLLLTRGAASVEKKGTEITRLRSYAFVGEMSFLSGKETTATVKALTSVVCMVWKKDVLETLINKDNELHVAIHTVFSRDLTQKLSVQ